MDFQGNRVAAIKLAMCQLPLLLLFLLLPGSGKEDSDGGGSEKEKNMLGWSQNAAIILHIVLCLLIFYTVYYMTGSICCGAFRLQTFDVLLPFEFKIEPGYSNPNYLANVLSKEITFFISGPLFAVLLKRWVWDYAITVTLGHVLMTFAVIKEFPLVWHWWLELASGLFLMIGSGELVTYFAFTDNSSG